MKVRLEDFNSALALFETEFISGMKHNVQRFLAGAFFGAKSREINAMLAQLIGEDGLIDTDELKSWIDAGMKQCGGAFEVPISFGVLAALGADPVIIKIDVSDIDKFFNQTLPAVARPTVPTAGQGGAK